jgi:hypothetical protein
LLVCAKTAELLKAKTAAAMTNLFMRDPFCLAWISRTVQQGKCSSTFLAMIGPTIWAKNLYFMERHTGRPVAVRHARKSTA